MLQLIELITPAVLVVLRVVETTFVLVFGGPRYAKRWWQSRRTWLV